MTGEISSTPKLNIWRYMFVITMCLSRTLKLFLLAILKLYY